MFLFKLKTAYEMRISVWSSDVYSSDLGSICQYTQRQSNRPSVQRPASQIERFGAKVAVSAYSASPCSRMWGGRNFNAAIINTGIIVPLAMPCRKRMASSRSRSWMKGMHTASKVHVPIIHSSKRRTESGMAHHAQKDIGTTTPALIPVVRSKERTS